MKKIVSVFVSALMLVSMFAALSVSGADASELDKNLVIFYDFEGETLEEQLKDKAPAGESKEDLKLNTTKDGASDLSYIKEGVAHIDRSGDNYLSCSFDSSQGIGKDIYNNKSELTVFAKFKVSGSPNSFVDIIDIGNVTRCYAQSAKNGPSTKLQARATSDMYRSQDHKHDIKDGTVYLDKDDVILALTMKYDADKKTLDYTSSISFDGGKNYSTSKTPMANVEILFSDSEWISFGKCMSGTMSTLDRGGTFDFDEFRIYNKTLSLDEIKTLTPQSGESETEAPSTEATNAPDTDTQAPSKTEKAETTANTTAAVTEEAKKSGCSSGITPVMFVCVSATVAMTAVLRKKKIH